MVKTVLKTAGMILGLAAIFFAALWFWEKQKETSEPPLTVSPEPEIVTTPMAEPEFPSISEMDVRKSEKGATIMLREVATEPVVERSGDSKEFYFVISGTALEIATPRIEKPHDLIAGIVATVSVANGMPSVRVDVEVTKDVHIASRVVGSTFYLDVEAKEEVKKPAVVAKKPAPKKPAAVVKKPIVKATPRPTPKPTPKPRQIVRRTPTPAPTVEPADNLLDDLLSESDVQPELEPLEDAPIEMPGDPSMDDIPFADEGTPDLDQLLEDSEAKFYEPEEMPKTASIPDSGTFSKSNIGGNLPTISDLKVGSEGGVTTVRLEMKKGVEARIFRMRNPSRVTIDLVGAKNGLKPTYGAFSGTKVQKIQTEEFSGPDGTISRVMIYVNGSPRYEKGADGSSLILKLP